METAIVEPKKDELKTCEPQTSTRVFVPQADVYESQEKIFVIADMPGVSEDSIDIVLEKNVLTIQGKTSPLEIEGMRLAHCEVPQGNYRRVFMLSEEVDQDAIEATIKNGVLKLTLPKPEKAKARKITVVAE